MSEKLKLVLEEYRAGNNSPTDFVSQFKRIGLVADWLASDEPTAETVFETQKIFTLLKDSSDVSRTGEYSLNLFQILRYAENFGYNDFGEALQILDDEARDNGYLLESFDDNHRNSERSTFLLSELVDESFIDADDYPDQIEGSRNLLEEIFETTENLGQSDQPRRIGRTFKAFSRFGEGLFSSANFNALASIHHEIAENALSHGTYSRLNVRSWPNHNPLFGNSFHLQINSFPFTRANQSTAAGIHPRFPDFHKEMVKLTGKKDHTYWIFSYCDTGGGILKHVSEFSQHPDSARPLKISDLIAKKISTRNFDGSGYGLEKICNFSRILKAFTVVDTPGSCFTFDGIGGRIDEMEERIQRGTMVSLLFSSQLHHAVSDI